MNINQHRQFTTATRKELGSQLANSIHFVQGVTSEILKELAIALINEDYVNAGEEIGDANWFLSEYANVWNLTTPDIYELAPEDSSFLDTLYINIGNLSDMDKGASVYNKEVSLEERQNTLDAVWKGLEYLALGLGLDSNKIRQQNIAKLKVRFGDKFDEYLAKNRNLEAELVALTS